MSSLRLPDGYFLIAVGKAAYAMTQGLLAAGSQPTGGIIIAPRKHNIFTSTTTFEEMIAAHPIPNNDSFRAGNSVLEKVRAKQTSDNFLVLISGGASALMSFPIDGISCETKRQVHESLISSGFQIGDINTVRRHISSIKGGAALREILHNDGNATTLALSDVPHDLPHDIGSGPFTADPTTFSDALAIASRIGNFPREALLFLEKGDAGVVRETLKPHDVPKGKSNFRVILGTTGASEKIAGIFRAEGAEAEISVFPHCTNPGQASDFFVETACKTHKPDIWIISVGEAEVSIKPGTHIGKGGRAATLLLETARKFHRQAIDFEICVLATDGSDGNSGLAGGFLSSEDMNSKTIGEIDAALKDFNSAGFLERIGRSFPGSPTGTNFGDAVIMRVRKP